MRSGSVVVFSAELEGISARLVEVEVDLNVGLSSFTIVGLGDKAVTEAKERVNSALKNSGVKPPNRENRKITVNLAPASLKKSGSHYDLAIAIGYLTATGQIQIAAPKRTIFLGELSLDGRLRNISGALNIAELALAQHINTIFLPRDNANEASAIEGLHVVPIDNLNQAIAVLEGKAPEPRHVFLEQTALSEKRVTLDDIQGQDHAKRALVIAAAGGHNLLLVGPPGSGKTMLAKALAELLPPLTKKESIEATKIWSAAGYYLKGLLTSRPFRAPHQTASAAAIIGGGTDPRPGEVSLANKGVLFLDEVPEFAKNILEALRTPLEDGVVRISRTQKTLEFPAAFSLIAAMNPCPCGYYGDPEKECRCTAYEVVRYQKKISGPLLDRIDLQVRVPRIKIGELRKGGHAQNAAQEAAKVVAARKTQEERAAAGISAATNSAISSEEAVRLAALDAEGERFLGSLTKYELSPRSYYRLLKTARTIADLDGNKNVSAMELAEAFSYRLRDTL